MSNPDIGISSSDRISVRNSLELVDKPVGFAWDTVNYPLTVLKDGPRHFKVNIDTRSKITSDVWNGPTYWVSPTGADTNSGTTAASPFRSISKARETLEASVAPGGIILTLADPTRGYTFWDRSVDFNKTGTAATQPSKPFALMGYGGKQLMGPIDNGMVYALDSATGTYSSTSRSNIATQVACIIDTTEYNRWGIFKRLTRIAGGTDVVATRALVVAAGPGTYATSSTDGALVVFPEKAAVVNATNFKVALASAGLDVGTVSAYVSGFSMWGGSNTGAMRGNRAATRNLVFEDCDASFSGIDLGQSANAWSIDNQTGLIVYKNCTSGGSLADLFNWHQTTGNAYGLMIDCKGTDAGHAGSNPVTTSDQWVTVHENFKLLSVNSEGSFSSGGVVRNIGASQHWDLGSTYSNDRGDTRYAGGDVISSGVQLQDTAEYWGDSITVKGCANTFYAGTGTKIHLRDPLEYGGVRAGGGVIDTY